MRRSLAVLLAVMLALAACSGGDADGDLSGACLPGDPNCADDPSGGSDDPADAPSGPLSVDDVVAAGSIDGPFVVTGFLFVDAAGEAELCSMVLESYPPQCGGSRLAVDGPLPVDQLTSGQGLQWSNDPVELEVTFDGTTLRVLSE